MGGEATVLSYADLPARHGITIDRLHGHLRIVIPPARWWQRPTLLGLLAPLVIFLYGVGVNALEPRRNVGGIVFFSLLSMLLLWAIVQHLFREQPTIVLLSDQSLSLRNVSPIFGPALEGKLPRRTFTFARQSIHTVYFAPPSGSLFIRAHGHEMLEVRIRGDRSLTEWLAGFLRQEMMPGNE